MIRLSPRSLRGRVVLAFVLGATAVTAALGVATYLIARQYLSDQRVHGVARQAFVDAAVASDRLTSAGADPQQVLDSLDQRSGARQLLEVRGEWFASTLEVSSTQLPPAMRTVVESGEPAYLRTVIDGAPVLVVGVPLTGIQGGVYELAPLDELAGSLRLLAQLLTAGTLISIGLGVLVGRYASSRIMRPLYAVAGTAADVASGNLASRLPETADPDLATIVGSFNSMVDALAARVQRDARFAADVSHELRSPLTTLVTSVDLLEARRAELSGSGRRALELVQHELSRFTRLLDDLLELARSDAGAEPSLASVDLSELVCASLTASGRDTGLLELAARPQVVVDKARMERVLVNLFDNADKYGGGLTCVRVTASPVDAYVLVDDEGPGVPAPLREQIFERFATAGTGRRDGLGTGLGLALVRETMQRHGGAVWCTDRPNGLGARFVLCLPLEST